MIRKTLGVIAATGLLAVAGAAPATAQPPEDPLGVVTIPPGEPIVIAGWGVLSGADASLGQDWVNSMYVAAEDRGNELLGHPLEIITEDGLCTPEGGATAAQKLASNPTIVGLIGSACSDETVGGIGTLTNAGRQPSRPPTRVPF
jgi:branched-chain amino acid transport system substrate-binding protein